MKFSPVQQSLEEFWASSWNYTAVQYENTPFDSELYNEYVRMSVAMNDSMSRTVTRGCYRVVGMFFVSIFVKPAVGSARALELADNASLLLVHKVVQSIAPLVAPKVNLKVPDLLKDFKERDGWVMVQVSCPFYYDLEI